MPDEAWAAEAADWTGLLQALSAAIRRDYWRQAAHNSSSGTGLEEGAPFEEHRAWRKGVRAKGHHEWAGMLDAVRTGAL